MATTYCVLNVSPGDMPEESLAATEAINNWNTQYAAAEGVVMLSVKYAVFMSGVRSQEAIEALAAVQRS